MVLLSYLAEFLAKVEELVDVCSFLVEHPLRLGARASDCRRNFHGHGGFGFEICVLKGLGFSFPNPPVEFTIAKIMSSAREEALELTRTCISAFRELLRLTADTSSAALSSAKESAKSSSPSPSTSAPTAALVDANVAKIQAAKDSFYDAHARLVQVLPAALEQVEAAAAAAPAAAPASSASSSSSAADQDVVMADASGPGDLEPLIAERDALRAQLAEKNAGVLSMLQRLERLEGDLTWMLKPGAT